MTYRLDIRRAALRALRRMDKPERQRVEARIGELARDPYAAHLDVKKLAQATGYRLRVGNWRVLYDVDDRVRIVSVEDVRQRGSAYR
jgi:mRNA interferase RelE/StbE